MHTQKRRRGEIDAQKTRTSIKPKLSISPSLLSASVITETSITWGLNDAVHFLHTAISHRLQQHGIVEDKWLNACVHLAVQELIPDHRVLINSLLHAQSQHYVKDIWMLAPWSNVESRSYMHLCPNLSPETLLMRNLLPPPLWGCVVFCGGGEIDAKITLPLPGVLLVPPYQLDDMYNFYSKCAVYGMASDELVKHLPVFDPAACQSKRISFLEKASLLFADIVPLLGWNVNQEPLKEESAEHDKLVETLYKGKQCSTCGLRHTDKSSIDSHMDWHFKKNKAKKQTSRGFYMELDWWKDDLLEGEQDYSDNESRVEEIQITADQHDQVCYICREPLVATFDQDEEEWVWKNVVRCPETRTVSHILCINL